MQCTVEKRHRVHFGEKTGSALWTTADIKSGPRVTALHSLSPGLHHLAAQPTHVVQSHAMHAHE